MPDKPADIYLFEPTKKDRAEYFSARNQGLARYLGGITSRELAGSYAQGAQSPPDNAFWFLDSPISLVRPMSWGLRIGNFLGL